MPRRKRADTGGKMFEIDAERWARAVAYLRRRLPAARRKELTRAIAGRDLETWAVEQHFSTGMYVRNLLRRGGHEWLGVLVDLDNVWHHLLAQALASERQEEKG